MYLGLDIGTSGSKAVVVSDDGAIVSLATRSHVTSSPRPGWFEHDAEAIWWDGFRQLTAQLLEVVPATAIAAVCVSGIGPCVLVSDQSGKPMRPALLYGIDTRAEREIDEQTSTLGEQVLLERCGNPLTTQAVGPKLAWLARHEPDLRRRACRWFSASNFLVFRLTGEYVADHYTASGSDPLYDLAGRDWWPQGWDEVAEGIDRPRLAWPGDVVGTITAVAAAATGLRAGTPVLAGTVDALAEAYGAGCRDEGDLMVMYGSTLFLIQTVARPVTHQGLWSLAGRNAETFSVSAGMATSGLVVNWLSELVQGDVSMLVKEAEAVAPGSDGLLLLPYFAGERTPIFDPKARGSWVGLTLAHSRAHLCRSVLEGVACGVRHNVEAMEDAGSIPRRLVAVGGGTRASLWTQVVSDVVGLPQELPTITIGAAYGDARLAADSQHVDTVAWNPVAVTVSPDGRNAAAYDRLYRTYRDAYPALRVIMHRLAEAAGAGDRAHCPKEAISEEAHQ